MRSIRQSLKQLLHEAGQQYQVGTLPIRLRAAMLHDAMMLLPLPGEGTSPVALHVRTISHGSLHRHMLMIRCPDQAFYLDAIKSYLSRHHIQTISHQTVVATLRCDDQQCQLFLSQPEDTGDDNFMLIAIHLSATALGNRQVLSPCDDHLQRVDGIADVARDIASILQAVEMSVADFPLMREKVQYISQQMLESDPIEAELLRWMNDDHYILYGLAMTEWRKGLMRYSDVLDAIIPDLRRQLERLPAAQSTGLEWLSLPALLNHIYSPSRMEVVRISWNEDAQLQQAVLIGYFSRSGRYTNASEIPRLKETWHAMCQARMVKYSSFYRREIRSLFVTAEALAAMRHAMGDARVCGGRFDVRFDDRRWPFRMIATMMNVRSRLTRISTGDQALFVRRQVFERMGGFPEQPLMEDIAFCRQLKCQGRIACLRQRVTTSARRWQQHGVARTIFLMWKLRWCYWRGVDIHHLARMYRDAR